MPVVKISLNDTYYQELLALANENGVSIQDYIRSKIFGDTIAYTPADAVKRALAKYEKGDCFTLPDIYDEEWDIERGRAGVFGKQFYNHVENLDQITFIGMTNYGRHAQYRMEK